MRVQLRVGRSRLAGRPEVAVDQRLPAPGKGREDAVMRRLSTEIGVATEDKGDLG